MAEKANKVKFNLKNTHYALLTIGEDGTPTFGTPVPMPGSVSISLDANGEPENFYADGGVYYVINNNCGYDGDLELAAFALLFEFDGDQKHIRHVLYNCSASRPGIEGKTNEDSKEVQTEKLSLKAVPLANGMVKAKTGNTTDATTYADWYKAVYVPAAENDAATQSAAKPAKAVKE